MNTPRNVLFIMLWFMRGKSGAIMVNHRLLRHGKLVAGTLASVNLALSAGPINKTHDGRRVLMPIRRKVFRIEARPRRRAPRSRRARHRRGRGARSPARRAADGLRQLKDETDSIFHAIKETKQEIAALHGCGLSAAESNGVRRRARRGGRRSRTGHSADPCRRGSDRSGQQQAHGADRPQPRIKRRPGTSARRSSASSKPAISTTSPGSASARS